MIHQCLSIRVNGLLDPYSLIEYNVYQARACDRIMMYHFASHLSHIGYLAFVCWF